MRYFPLPLRRWRLLAVFATLMVSTSPAPADNRFAVGDRVTVDTSMAGDPAYQTWKPATITAVQMWNGQVSGISVRTDEGLEITTAARFLRPGTAASAESAPAIATGAAESSSVSDQPSPDPGVGNCRVGGRVIDRDEQAGVVVRASGPSCHVRLDATGQEGYYLQWMLTPADEGTLARRPADVAGLEPGSYRCWAANGVAGTLKLVIIDASRYGNGAGSEGHYALDASTGAIRFESGPWEGFFGSRLDEGRIGISSRPGGFSTTTCNRG